MGSTPSVRSEAAAAVRMVNAEYLRLHPTAQARVQLDTKGISDPKLLDRTPRREALPIIEQWTEEMLNRIAKSRGRQEVGPLALE